MSGANRTDEARIKRFGDQNGPIGWTHYCPGCESMHAIWVDRPNERTGALWKFNGDTVAPTFKPSVNITGQCHYWITGGRIKFEPDCRHVLAGQIVDLPIPWGRLSAALIASPISSAVA